MKKMIQFFLYRNERILNSYSETTDVNRVMGSGLNDIDDIISKCKFNDRDAVYLKILTSVEMENVNTMLNNLGKRLKKLRIASAYSYGRMGEPEKGNSFTLTIDENNTIVKGRFFLEFYPV